MSSNPIIVNMRGVDVEIECVPILHAIDLDVARGGHLGIVGGNGSGKSTLLALIAGRRWPAPGRGSRRYDFGGGPESDAVTARERIALIGHELQDIYIARRWNFRVRDVVLSGLTRSDIPKRRISRAQIDAACALVEALQIGDLKDRRLLELSRGEQRRVLIARALAFRPALLLLDEPLSGLDAAARTGLETTLTQAAAQTTIVIAAHRDSELPAFVTQVVRLHDGRLSRASTPDVRDTPQAPQVHTRSTVPAPATTGASAPELLIELVQASAWLGGRPVLKDLDWQLRAGEQWLVVGPNGAGKSTLLRLLHGELRPALGGSIRWPGLGHPRDVWTLRRRIALVSPELQARYLYPTSVFDAVASGFHASIGLVRELSSAQRERVRTLLDAFALDALGSRWLSSLSYGQRHRVLIARTLAAEPCVLLLDEPWAGLDRDTTARIAAELTRRMAAGTSVVCVSHVGARGLPLNRVLNLDAGRISRVGDSAGPHENSASAQRRAADSPPR
jgi:molybdate transport system ATP-binding protein